MKLEMTAMIDIVFQLMVYFILTFKVTALEGDFNINMPTAAESPTKIMDPLDKTIAVHLTAAEGGGAGPIEVVYGNDRQTYSDEFRFARLREYVKNLVLQTGDPAATNDFEVEFNADRSLDYEYTVKAVEAVSGEVNPDGGVAKLIQKIRFKDNRPRQSFVPS